MLINFVYSTETSSGIFSAIEAYFHSFLSPKWELISSAKPIPGADVYHYHRPHLEREIKPNSIATVHHDLNDLHPTLAVEKFLDAYAKMDAVVCLNQIQYDCLEAQGIKNCHVIPHGVTKRLFTRTERPPMTNKLNLGITSKRYGHYVKGEKYWYEMMRYLNPDHFKFTLVGMDRSLDEPILQKLGFDYEIFDYLPYSLYPDLYKNLHLLCVFSVFEGGPANIPEAVMSGVPILGRRIGMIPEAIEHGNGILLPDCPRKGAKLLSELTMPSSTKLEKMFMTAHTAPLPLDWKDVVDRYAELYSVIAETTYC